MFTKLASATVPVAALLTLSACGSGSGTASTAAEGSGDKVDVVTSFYPLQFAAQRVGGQHVEVSSLTKAGAEPHDLELTPKDVAGLSKAKVVVYEKGFQPAVDEAVESQAKEQAFDVSSSAKLDLAATEEGHDHEGESPEEHAQHAHTSTQDPHFWLDPTKYAAVVTALGERMATADPAHAADYRKNAETFVSELTTLDSEFKTGLASCKSEDLVTGHAAFGYLAKRYGLHQEGIAGISPDAEPTPVQMKEIVSHIKEHGVKTVYAETLVSPALANTIAKETGAKVEVLDPIEGITSESKGKDYLEVMRSNLATLKTGQQCS